jgi:hypothetical protein
MKPIVNDALAEIAALGGVIDRVEQRRHVRLYWRLGDRLIVSTIPAIPATGARGRTL